MYSLELFVLDERFKLGSARDRHIERLGCEERLEVEQVEVVVVHKVCQQLIGQSVQRRHDGQTQVPLAVCASVHVPDQINIKFFNLFE